MAHLAEHSYQDKLKVALEQHFGGPLALKVAPGEISGETTAALEAGEREARRTEAVRAIHGDQFVQDLVDMFDAKVVDSSVKSSGDKA